MASNYHLAQYNIARLVAPLEDPRLKPFMEALGRLNRLAESIDSLFQYACHSDHAEIFRRLREFFEPSDLANLVLWWIPTGHIPSVDEAKELLDLLRENGPTPDAFTFKLRFEPPA